MTVTQDRLSQPSHVHDTALPRARHAGTGLWDRVGGVAKAGEDIVVGVVDTGIWPEHPSFSDQKDLVFRTGSSGKRNLAYGPAPAGWTGTCQSGEQFSQDIARTS